MKLLCLILLLFTAREAIACTGLSFDVDPPSVTDLNTNPTPAMNFRIKRQGGASCDYFLTVSYGSATSFSTRSMFQGSFQVPMNVYVNAGLTQVIRDVPEATNDTQVITGSFEQGHGSHTTNDHTYYAALGTIDYNRFGNYSDTFVMKLYEGTVGNSPVLRDTANVTFTYTMARKIDLSIVSSGSGFNPNSTAQNLNFGALTAGNAKSCDLILKFNAGYSIRLASQNNGKLKHASLSDTVPYTMRVNSVPVSLLGSSTTPVEVTNGTGVSPPNGLTFPLSATIGSIGAARAGNYSDVITITVATSE